MSMSACNWYHLKVPSVYPCTVNQVLAVPVRRVLAKRACYCLLVIYTISNQLLHSSTKFFMVSPLHPPVKLLVSGNLTELAMLPGGCLFNTAISATTVASWSTTSA